MPPHTLIATATLLALPLGALAQKPRQIAEGVFVLQPTDGRGGWNAGWVDLGGAVLAIIPRDGVGDAAVERIRRTSGKPVRLAFAPNGRATSSRSGAILAVPASRGAGAGGLAFTGRLTVGEGSRVEIRELERAVSAGNGVVYLAGTGVLFAGDLVGEGAVVDSARTDAWIENLERLRRLAPRVVVPGRGAVGGSELLEKTWAALVAARSHVKRGLEEGRSIDQLVGSLPANAAGASGTAIARHIYREMVGLVPPPMIDELELREGPSATTKAPGWTKPTAVLVRDMWTDKRVAQLGLVAPGVEIRVARTADEAAAAAVGADASLGWLSPDVIRQGSRLRWIQSPSAGVEGILAVPGFVDSPITLTNAARIYGPPIAEHVFGMVLSLTRGVPIAVPLMRERRWNQAGFPSQEMPELGGKTLLVVGLGGIGTEVAKLGHGLGMRVIATRNNKTPPTDIVEYVGGSNELLALARESDVVVNCLPLTRATEKMFNAELFAAMKPTAYFVNIGRGRTVDTDALVRALEEKRIAGAGLDVTDPEPLPPDHRLWSFANVVITPHVASNSDSERERTWLLFRENLRRFVNGEPLLSVVDKKAGY